jgi:cytochrome c-type biogenesis protein CcmH
MKRICIPPILCALLLTVALMTPGVASAQDGHDHSAHESGDISLTPEQETIATGLEDEFISPCCWHQALSAHDSPVAREMKVEIRSMLADGKSVDDIRTHYIELHGERIMTVPPGGGFNHLVWIIPLVAGVFGVGIAGQLLRSWKKHSSSDGAAQPNKSADKTVNGKLEEQLRAWDT